MAKRDYYEVLGVSRSVTEVELKKAYRKLALECHPDRNQTDPTAEARFKEVSEAYSVLQDQEKRQTYDRFGHAGLAGGQQGFGSVEDIFSHFGDVFGDLFGMGGMGGRARRADAPTRGADLRVGLRLTLEEAAFGGQHQVDVAYPSPCTACSGTGAEDSQLDTCRSCDGMGQVAYNRGAFMLSTTCPTCGGRGRIPKSKCTRCEGTGQEHVERSVKVSVPAGIDAGQTLRIGGQGQAGTRGGPSGHLYVVVDVEEHERFHRDGFELIYDLMLSYPRAALGGKVEVPTLDLGGRVVTVEIPAGVQPGDQLVVRGEGVQRLDGRGKGDLITVVHVDVPKKLSTNVRKLLVELQQSFDAESGADEPKQGAKAKKKKS